MCYPMRVFSAEIKEGHALLSGFSSSMEMTRGWRQGPAGVSAGGLALGPAGRGLSPNPGTCYGVAISKSLNTSEP